MDNNTIIVGDYNNTLTSMEKSSRQKINKKTVFLKKRLDQLDLQVGYLQDISSKTSQMHIFFKCT